MSTPDAIRDEAESYREINRMAGQPYLTLNDGFRMPQLGLGVWQVGDDEAPEVVTEALRIGYRSIDTAQLYGNEAGVGRGLAAAGLTRREMFVTSKLKNSEQGYDTALAGFELSLQRLGLDYLDLYLIHWPVPALDTYADTWRAFVRLQQEGRVRSIGVSNFQPEHLKRIIGETGVTPAINQVELHPHFQQRDIRDVHKQRNIQLESYSPLARGAALKDRVIVDVAAKHGRTEAQVVIRWHLQEGLVVIPKSSNPARLAENFAALDFVLDADDMAEIAGVDRQSSGRQLDHPDEMNDPS